MNPIEFSRNLFELRTERQISVEALAERLGVTPETVCEWECAKTTPTMEQSMRLAEIYGVPLDEIVRNPRARKEASAEPESEEAPPAPDPSLFETEDEPAAEAAPEPSEEPERRRIRVWEIAVILLLLLIIAAAVFFLIRPDLFPFPSAADAAAVFSARSGIGRV